MRTMIFYKEYVLANTHSIFSLRMSQLSLLIKLFAIFLLVSVVFCDHQKRDVHHKIVIQDRRPRNSQYSQHKKNQGDQKNRHYSGYHEESRHRQKKKHKFYNDHSLENYDSGKENSYEEVYKPKVHKSRQKYPRPDYFYSQEASEEIKPYHRETPKQEWKPLIGYDEPDFFSAETKEEHYNHKKLKKNFRPSSFNYQFTTKPALRAHVPHYHTPLYPPLTTTFNTLSLKSSNHLDLLPKYETLPTFEETKNILAKSTPSFNVTTTFVKQKNSYEVTEPNVEDNVPPRDANKPFLVNITDSNLFSNTFKPFILNQGVPKKNDTKIIPLQRGRTIRGKRKHI